MSRSLSAASASAYASLLAAEAAALSASAFARRSASSSRASRVFRSCASRRSAAGSLRRLVVEVSADLMTEAAADFSRVSGALRWENKTKSFLDKIGKGVET